MDFHAYGFFQFMQSFHCQFFLTILLFQIMALGQKAA